MAQWDILLNRLAYFNHLSSSKSCLKIQSVPQRKLNLLQLQRSSDFSVRGSNFCLH
jgi:hypothetical protein